VLCPSFETGRPERVAIAAWRSRGKGELCLGRGREGGKKGERVSLGVCFQCRSSKTLSLTFETCTRKEKGREGRRIKSRVLEEGGSKEERKEGRKKGRKKGGGMKKGEGRKEERQEERKGEMHRPTLRLAAGEDLLNLSRKKVEKLNTRVESEVGESIQEEGEVLGEEGRGE